MKRLDNHGFTLVELMIALLLSSLVMVALGVFFRMQQKNYIDQEEVAEMQQEVRAGIEIMSRELRNAGHDMTAAKGLGAGFVVARVSELRFTMDIGDALGGVVPNDTLGDPNEDVRYRLVVDADNNGIADGGGVGDLGREVGGAGGLQPLVSNVQAIGFAYAVDELAPFGEIDLNPAGQIRWMVPTGGGWTDLDVNNDGVIDENDIAPAVVAASATERQQIRAVRIWLLTRASRPDPQYINNNRYKVGANVIDLSLPAANDNFRRRLLVTTVRCRNMGLPSVP